MRILITENDCLLMFESLFNIFYSLKYLLVKNIRNTDIKIRFCQNK